MVVGPVNGGWGVAMGTLGTERGTTLLAEHLRIKREVDEMIDAARAMHAKGFLLWNAEGISTPGVLLHSSP